MGQSGKHCLHREKSYHLSEISPALRWNLTWVGWIHSYKRFVFRKWNSPFRWDLTQVRYPTQAGCLALYKQLLRMIKHFFIGNWFFWRPSIFLNRHFSLGTFFRFSGYHVSIFFKNHSKYHESFFGNFHWWLIVTALLIWYLRRNLTLNWINNWNIYF